ncbi:perlwapin-like [Sinocyclocheilus rhinocerous]|uniref:perlwapin-like n=1 Tax=Sinocyclocheilus rhinocerous TaxID=307959 RepID=UPI0007B82576|nr:PREDICTED: perlwapin-like [Sinocyclocheilus rhinocerous]
MATSLQAESIVRPQVERMPARVCCSLIAVLLCLSVYLSTTDARVRVTVKRTVQLDKELLPAKPGVCPINNLQVAVLGMCVESCSHDSDCPNDEKCCSNGCGHQCMPPYAAKPGVCPINNLQVAVLGMCVESCSHDSDCPNDEKCCSNGCGHQCMPPYAEKPGVCPRRVLGVGLCAKLCAHDIDCPKDEKCCSTICGRECTPPYKVRPGLCLRPMC